MALLLTSNGVANPSIHLALEDLLGKPVADSNALFVPTGMHPFPVGFVGPPGHAMAREGDRAIGLVDFALWVHLDNPDPAFADHSVANIERWAAGIPVPTYAIDDQTAIKVFDGAIDVVSEGHWSLVPPVAAG